MCFTLDLRSFVTLTKFVSSYAMFQVVSDAMLAELKQCFMEAYDDNQDGKIDIREVTFQFNLFFFL